MAELGRTTFASSVRTDRISQGAQPAAGGLPRLEVPASLTVTGTKDGAPPTEHPAGTTLELLGPGDVVGIAPSEILRVFPNAGEPAAEPNYLASIELDSPELPWLVSLSTAEPVQPWIALVVVPDPLGSDGDRPGSLLPWLFTKPADLPPWDELHLWAHAQAQGSASLATPGPGDGRATLSRLICPTRLQPDTRYLAAVVPTYQAGVLAAMRQNPQDAGTRPSWDVATEAVELPMYHHWRFATGGAGDFEALARQLSAVHPATITGLGRIDLRIDDDEPGGLAAAPDVTLPPLRTLLISPDSDAAPPVPTEVEEELAAAVDHAAGELRVRPPRYGEWPAGEVPVREGPPWYQELNLRPHHRVIARVGADLVRAQQEELVAEAQRQLGEYKAARRARDLLRLGEITASRLHSRAIAEVPPARVVTTARPALVALTKEDPGVLTAMAADGLGRPLLATAFARLAQRVSARAGGSAAAMRADFVAGSMSGDLVALAATAEPAGIDPDRVRSAFGRAGLLDQAVDGIRVQQLIDLAPAAQEAQDQLVEMFRAERIDIQPVPDQPAPEEEPVEHGRIIGRLRPDDGQLRHLQPHVLDVLAAQPQIRDLNVAELGALRAPVDLPLEIADLRIAEPARATVLAHVTTATTPLLQLALQHGVADAAVQPVTDLLVDARTLELAVQVAPGADTLAMQIDARDAVRRGLGLSVFGPVLRDQLTVEGQHEFDDVVATLAARQVTDVLRFPAAPDRVSADQVAEVFRPRLEARTTYTAAAALRLPFAAGISPLRIEMGFVPTFDAPLAARLERSGNRWILAGADRVPPNSLTVLLTNPEFVEALLVGANHELARELMWRDVPSDPRRTVFRRFWDNPPSVPELNLSEVQTWKDSLGTNPPTAAPFLCVVVRSPLLRRYPNTVVQAAQGTIGPAPGGGGPNFDPDPNTFRPRLFQGSIAPDLTFSVLKLTRAEVANADNPWYLLLGEPVTEPKFGLDATVTAGGDTWRNLSWDDLGESHPLLRRAEPGLQDPAREGVTWGTDAAAMARILHQDPFRLVLPAADFVLGV